MHGRVALLAATAVIACPGTASAATFHAAQDGASTGACPAAAPCSLGAAITAADAAPGPDVVQVLGALEAGGTADLTASPIELVGSGSEVGGTLLDGGGGPALRLGAQSSARDLRAVATAVRPIRMAEGARLTRVLVRVLGGGAAAGVQVEGGPGAEETLLDAVQVTQEVVTGDGNGIAVDGPADRTVLRDVAVQGPADAITRSGLDPATIVVQRARLAVAGDGADLRGPVTLRISSSLIRALESPGDPTTTFFNGLRLRQGAQADVRHVTIDGTANTGYLSGDPDHRLADGLDLAEGATADVRGSALLGVYTALECVGTSTGVIQVTGSYFDPAHPESSPSCPVQDLGGNLSAPGPPTAPFADATGGDYALLAGSVLVDAAGSEPAGPDESPTDIDGRERRFDGDGDGIAARDIGAHEFGAPLPGPAPEPPAPVPPGSEPPGPGPPAQAPAPAGAPAGAARTPALRDLAGLPRTVRVSRRGSARVGLTCRARTTCTLLLRLRADGRTTATRLVRLRPGARTIARIALGPRTGRTVRARGRLAASLILQAAAGPRTARGTVRVTLRPERPR
jgi:hypothetical protein